MSWLTGYLGNQPSNDDSSGANSRPRRANVPPVNYVEVDAVNVSRVFLQPQKVSRLFLQPLKNLLTRSVRKSVRKLKNLDW